MARLLTNVLCLLLVVGTQHFDAFAQQFRKIDGPPGGSFDQVHISRIKQNVIYAHYADPAREKPSVTYVTTNGGVNWRPIFTEDLPSTYIGPNFTTIPWGDNDLELVEYMHGDTLIYGYDQGTRWEKVQTNVALTDIFIHPKVQRIRVGRNGSSWYRSLDIGSTWDSIPTPPIDGRLAFAPSDVKTVYLYSGMDHYVSHDTASTWTRIDYTSQTAFMNDVVVDQTDPNYLVAACSDLTRWSDDGGKTWNVDLSTRTRYLLQHPQAPSTYYGWGLRFMRSIDKGKTWEMVDPMTPAVSDVDAYGDLIVTGGRYDQLRAIDEGSALSRNITGDIRRFSIIDDSVRFNVITNSRRLHAVRDDLIYLAGVYDIARTTDKGATWTLHDPSDSTLPWRPEISSMAASRKQPGLLFAVSLAVFRSVDSGATWSSIRSLTPISPNSIVALSPLDAQHVIIGGEGFISRSTDQGETWRNATPITLSQTKGTPIRMEMSRVSDASWIIVSKESNRTRYIHITTDAGVTWKSTSEQLLLFAYETLEVYPDVVDPKTFYICGIDPSRKRADYTIVTTNAGASWQENTIPSTAFLLPAREQNSLQWSVRSRSAVVRQHPNGTWHQQRSDSTLWIRSVDNLSTSQIMMATREELFVFEPDVLVSVGEKDHDLDLELNAISTRLMYSDDGWLRLSASEGEIDVFDLMGRKVSNGPYVGAPGIYLVQNTVIVR